MKRLKDYSRRLRESVQKKDAKLQEVGYRNYLDDWITGIGKIAAHIPGRCAALPAPAMITLNPFSSAFFAYSKLPMRSF